MPTDRHLGRMTQWLMTMYLFGSAFEIPTLMQDALVEMFDCMIEVDSLWQTLWHEPITKEAFTRLERDDPLCCLPVDFMP